MWRAGDRLRLDRRFPERRVDRRHRLVESRSSRPRRINSARSGCVSDGRLGLTNQSCGTGGRDSSARLLADGVKPGEPGDVLRTAITAVWASYGGQGSGAASAAQIPRPPRTSDAMREHRTGVKRVVTTAAEAPLFQSLGCEDSTSRR